DESEPRRSRQAGGLPADDGCRGRATRTGPGSPDGRDGAGGAAYCLLPYREGAARRRGGAGSRAGARRFASGEVARATHAATTATAVARFLFTFRDLPRET